MATWEANRHIRPMAAFDSKNRVRGRQNSTLATLCRSVARDPLANRWSATGAYRYKK
jgi:hypothetical protein